MKERDIYGFEVKAKFGRFRRWFNSNTICYEPMQPDLKDFCMVQINFEFIKAYNYCKQKTRRNDFEFRTLTEEDFKATGNPVKKFFKKMFGKNKQ